MNKLLQRIVTAACLIAGLVSILLAAPRGVAIGAIGTFILLAAWEWAAFLGWVTAQARIAYTGILACCLAATFWLVPDQLGLNTVLVISLAWWTLAFLWIIRYPTPIPSWLAAIAGVLVLVPAWIATVSLLRVEPNGPALVLLVLVIVWVADIGAYFVGRRFGSVKLSPMVSPGKTWEGLIGGLASASIAAAAGGLILGMPVVVMLPVGLGVAAISVVGDLTESMFKRNVGLKDSGTLFPGHGGVLDRIDSVTAAVPLFVLFLQWLGMVRP